MAYFLHEKGSEHKEWIAQYPHLQGVENSQQILKGASKEINGTKNYELLNSISDSILIELALLVGMTHICLSMIRNIRRNWQGIGWILAIIGSYLYFPQMLNSTTMAHYLFGLDKISSAQQGFYLIFIGYGLAVCLAIFKNKWMGLLEITAVIPIFSDVLSYLRLYALGLAGGVIGVIVNDLSSSMFFLGGAVLFIIGHGLNMILALIGGIIHGLRLNFIEWYHYSFEGGGKLFDPLRKIEIEK